MYRIFRANITVIPEAEFIKEYNLLKASQRDKISVLKQGADKRRTLAGLRLLRLAIKEMYGIDDFKITYNKNGKPLLDFCFFNISHSDNEVVCVVGDKPIGVDIERFRDIKKRHDYRFFTYYEVQYVNSTLNDLSYRFLEVWTKKEAYIKMKGLSLFQGGEYDVFKVKNCAFKTEICEGYMLTVCEEK